MCDNGNMQSGDDKKAKKTIKKLCLGTAQFGMDYGIANESGKILPEEVSEILDFAYIKNVKILDTASSYGDSEKLIGDYTNKTSNCFDVITKVVQAEGDPDFSIRECVEKTLKGLKMSSLYGCLFHCNENIHAASKVLKILSRLKNIGLVKKIGVSIYTTEELDYLLDNFKDFDLIQFPYSIIDQRFEKYFLLLKDNNVEVHVRSVFLQGLVFLGKDRISKEFLSAQAILGKIYQIANELDISVVSMCLCFALINPFIDNVIVGVDSADQLKQNLDSVKECQKVNLVYDELKALSCNDENILLPYKWT